MRNSASFGPFEPTSLDESGNCFPRGPDDKDRLRWSGRMCCLLFHPSYDRRCLDSLGITVSKQTLVISQISAPPTSITRSIDTF
jgi:hypothetical protein